MTNTIAVVLGILLVAFFVGDQMLFDGSILIFLGGKLGELIEYIAFWR